METLKNDGAVKTSTRKNVKVKTVEDIRPSDRVEIDNLCDWNINFAGIDNARDIVIPAAVQKYKNLTVAEVDAQVKTGNFAFVGTDGMGQHAAIRIKDALIREYIFGEEVDPVQLTEENVKALLDVQSKAKFNEMLENLVVTKAEKRMILKIAERIGVDDVPSYKLTAIERFSGMKFD